MVETTDNTSVDTGAETQNEDVTSLIEGVNYNFLAETKPNLSTLTCSSLTKN